MDKIWLKSYPPGIPAEVDLHEFQSIGDLFERSVDRFRDKVAFENLGRQLTYGELDRLSARFAAYLRGALGLPKGARVALMMPNMLQYPAALFGALRAGCVVVNCNPLYTPRELEHQLRDSGATVVVILENFARTLQEVLPRLQVSQVVVTAMGDLLGFPKGALVNFVVRRVKKMVPDWSLPGAVGFREALAQGDAHPFMPEAVGHSDLAFLQYTGEIGRAHV